MRLTTYLLSRLLLSGTIILILTISWLMFTNHERAQQDVRRIGDTVLRILEIQSVGPLQGIGLEPRFPDWYPVTQVKLPPGACVKFLMTDGKVRHSSCRGKGQSEAQIPAWFAWLYRHAFTVAEVARRDLNVREQKYVIEVIPDAEIEIADVWGRTKLTFSVALLVISVLGATAAILIRRAFNPIQQIVDSLERIGRGDFAMRLDGFRFKELNQIAQGCNSLATELGEKKRQRDALFERLQTAQDDERRAIALELHDEFGQYLTAINANAVALQSTVDIATVQADAKRIQGSVERLMALVQSLLSRLKPNPAMNHSLVEMVRNLIAEASHLQTDELTVELEVDGPVNECPEKVTMVGYRIIQEALTNIRKHADATQVRVKLALEEAALKISISDNGSVKTPDEIVPGFGISGMKERAATLGGRLDIRSTGERGLTIEACFPVYREEMGDS